MTRQTSICFRKEYLGDTSTSIQLNRFLSKHPNYTVDKISFDNPKGTCIENLFIVFNVETECKE